MILTDIIRTGGQTSWVPVVTDTPRVASVTNGLDKGATTSAQVRCMMRLQTGVSDLEPRGFEENRRPR